MSKSFKNPIDIINNLDYIENTNPDSSYERGIVEIMINEQCTLVDALDIDFDAHLVDKESVIDMVDYLEERLKDLNKVNLLMNIYTGRYPDMKLDKL